MSKSKDLRKALDNIKGDVECLEVLKAWLDRCGFEIASQDVAIEIRKSYEATEPDLFNGPMFEKPEVKKHEKVKAAALNRDTCINCKQKLHGFIGYIDSAGEIYCEDCMKGAKNE